MPPSALLRPALLQLSIFALLLLYLTGHAFAQAEAEKQIFYEQNRSYAGLFELENGKQVIIGLIPEATIVYLSDMTTGDMRFLELEEGHLFSFGPTRSVTRPAVGQVRFTPDEHGTMTGLTWTQGEVVLQGHRVPFVVEEVRFRNGESAELSGQLMTPPGSDPYPLAVLVPQSDRFDLWEVGLWLLSRGIGVLAYDQRNAAPGASIGTPVSGYYHEQQQVYMTDAVAAVTFIRAHPRVDARRVGVVGWSGGAWMGAMVAARVPDLAFYVNIAGNASPGIDQAQHRFLARLLREGFSDEDVAEAERFLTLHHDVARGKVRWEAYIPERERVSGEAWYQFLTTRFNMTYADENDATTWGSAVASAPAERTYEQVTVPTLGLFFEFDHSSTPDTPLLFHRALHRAGNGDYAIHVFPDTHHGGFEVESYRFDTQKLERRPPEIFLTLVDWVARHANTRQD